MPNIASALKAEISRIARKELRSETDTLKKAVSRYRSEIAALKRRMHTLERQQPKPGRRLAAKERDETEPATRYRFSATGLAMHRKRLGISAAEYATLIGVSALSVYKWEAGQARPRERYLPAIAAVRKMGKREAARRLEENAAK